MIPACCIPLSDIGYMETQHFICSNGHYGAIGDLGDVSWYSDVNFLYHDVSKSQQISSHPMLLLLEFHSPLGVSWALRFFGFHGNGCQGNQSLDIFQPLWPKGPPAHKISQWSGRKHLRYPEADIGFVLYYVCYCFPVALSSEKV